ncbi:MAG: HDOD domain-containing protein [Deltaproteobacteria bacterium]|nr:HDOD domain-containing protein [Deltaproteobacteria bacterium]
MEHLDFTDEIKHLPGSVDACTKLRKAITGGKATATELGELLSLDSILAARVLKLANSPFYGIGKPVSSLKQAVILLGQRLIGHLILSATMNVMTTSDILKPPLDPDLFWTHSLVSAFISKKLASDLGSEAADEAFTMGLLHDIGVFLLILKFKRIYPNLLMRFGDSTEGMRTEMKMLKTSHCDAAGVLFEKWHIPSNIGRAIENHHGEVTSGLGFLPVVEEWTKILGYPLVNPPKEPSVPKFLKFKNTVYVTTDLKSEIEEFLVASK